MVDTATPPREGPKNEQVELEGFPKPASLSTEVSGRPLGLSDSTEGADSAPATGPDAVSTGAASVSPLEEHIARHDFEATTGVRAGEVEDTPRSASPHTTEASLPGVQIVIELCLNNDAVEGSISVAVNSLEDVPKTYDSDTEPDLDAIVASLAADTDPPDVPMPEVGQTATTDSAMKCEPSEQVMPKMEHQVPLEVKMSASSRAPDVVPAGSLEQHIDRPPSKSEDSVPPVVSQPVLGVSSCPHNALRAAVESELIPLKSVTTHVYMDCPGLGSSQLCPDSAEHILVAPKVGNRHLVYGPTLAPADKYLSSQVQIARGLTVGVHTFSQLMFDIEAVEQEWEQVCPISAHTILHRSVEVARAAKRLPAHRLDPHAEFTAGVFWKLRALHPNPVRLVLAWFGICSHPEVQPRQIVIRGFSAGSYTGAAAALLASRISQSFRLHLTLGGISMSESVFVQLCHLAALQFEHGPRHHVRLFHFLADKLCGWRPPPLAKWLMQHMHVTLIQGTVDWMSKDQHMYHHLLHVALPDGTWAAHALAVSVVEFRPQVVRLKLPLRLASWMQSIRSEADLSFVVDMLHLDDLTFRRQVLTHLQAHDHGHEPSDASEEQVKDLVLSNLVITLGSKKTVSWLSNIARTLLRPLPLKALTVLIHAFLPQLTYEGETAIASTPMVSRASLDGMQVTATPVACGHEHLHEFWFSFPSPKDPIAFWIPSFVANYSASQSYESHRSSVQLNLDEGTVLAFVCKCTTSGPVVVSRAPTGEDKTPTGEVRPAARVASGEALRSPEATGPLAPDELLQVTSEAQCFVFCGLVGHKERPKKAAFCTQDWHRTQLKGVQVMLLPGVNTALRHLLPRDWDITPGVPSSMLEPAETSLQVKAILKVGKTLGGSQLMNIAHLPAVHRPFVMGIPHQVPCAPFAPEHKDALTDSLFLLLKLFVTQDTSLLPFQAFCKQLLQEAIQDAGHLISAVAAIGGCLESGRSSLALAGIFGAGKTTSMAFILMWLALTTPPEVRFTVVSKENPAGQAIASQVERMDLPEEQKLLFCRACGSTEWDDNEGKHFSIDAATRDYATHQRVAKAKVLVVTTGTAFKAVDHWHPEIAAHIGASCLFVHEEGQQAAELLSVSAVSMTRVPCFVIYVGDGNQSPGGIKDSKLAQFLRVHRAPS